MSLLCADAGADVGADVCCLLCDVQIVPAPPAPPLGKHLHALAAPTNRSARLARLQLLIQVGVRLDLMYCNL